MTPWLSVIVPVHGGEPFLGATLASAAAERPDGVEFLLYDSGEDDGACERIAAGWADRLAIRYVRTPEIKPWTAKTNRGAGDARASHIVMLHQDDLWLPGHLDALRGAIAEAPEAALSIGPSRFISAAGRDVGQWRLPFRPGQIAGVDFIAAAVVQNTIAIPSPLIRRDAWEACGGMDEALWYTADWDLYLKLARAGPIHVRTAATTAFRLHGSSLTMTGSRDAAAFREQMETVLERHLPQVPIAQRGRQDRLARTAIDVNCALAAGARGGWRSLAGGAGRMLALAPRLPRFLHQTRLVDRTLPRLRLALGGGL